MIDRMKYTLVAIFLLFSLLSGLSAQKIDLTAKWDTTRVLLNPDKGWYHHYMDNGIKNYKLKSDAELDTFPGMHHLFVRIAWSYLEPKEGEYHWETIDTIVARYVPKGYKLSLDITCKETEPDQPYATPKWVQQAGAKGQFVHTWGSKSWEPDYNDPVFLEKLNRFHQTMAVRYDGKEWLQDVTTGSIGEWGEGHSSHNVRADVVIKHLNILLDNYKHTQIVIGDDYLRAGKTDEETLLIRNYVKSHKVSYRDDSIYWEGVIDFPGSVQNPSFFEDVWRDSPTTLEFCHYRYYKDTYWSVPDGRIKGLDIAKKAIEVSHATFVSPHGHIGEWQKDNPNAAWELINKMGYWFFPQSVEASLSAGKLHLNMAWFNKGVAPAYKPYYLQVTLTDMYGKMVQLPVVAAGNNKWMPGTTSMNYALDAAKIPNGTYYLDVQLYKQFEDGGIRPVRLGLSEKYESSQGVYRLGTIQL